MSESPRYVPILKAKRGDRWALKNLSSRAGDIIIPLLEPVLEEDQSPRQQIEVVLNDLKDNWKGTLWLDQRYLGFSPNTNKSEYRFAFEVASQLGMSAVPVVHLGAPIRMIDAYRQLTGKGIVVRIFVDDLEHKELLLDALKAVRKAFALKRSQVDLLLDYGSTAGGSGLAAIARAHIGGIHRVKEYRSLTVAAGSFPDTVSDLAAGPDEKWHRLSRKEWSAYQRIQTGSEAPSRLPSFGDYGPRGIGLPRTKYGGSPNLRYTKDGVWLVRRGRYRKNSDMHSICTELIESGNFSGVDWSEGDHQIDLCAKEKIGCGGGEQWTQWGMSHHLETVAAELGGL